jgi:hypothetical protein
VRDVPPFAHLDLRPRSTQRRTMRRTRGACSVTPFNRERCCPSHSPTLRPWIAATLGYVVLRGGALEPGALVSFEKSQAKARAYSGCDFPCRSTEEPFSLGRGLIRDQRFFKLSIFLSLIRGFSPETTKATRWVALA